MTPKEKAKELVDIFNPFCSNEATTEDGFIYSDAVQLWNAKQCALIAVDEIIEILDKMDWTFTIKKADYFREVQQEIEKI